MYKWWDKTVQLKGSSVKPIAFDTETTLIEGPLHTPIPALAMCYAGQDAYLIHPEDIAEFFYRHRTQHIVGHNLQFDFWVVHEFVGKPIKRILWDMGDKNLLHDTMILDQLLQLGTGKFRGKGGEGFSDENARVTSANLAVLSKEAGSLPLNKEDPYRLRFGELVGLTKQQMCEHPEWEGFTKYAVDDVIATYTVYPYLYDKAVKLMYKAGYDPKKTTNYEILPTALEKYGPLSEYIQVRGSITLAHLSRQPLPINLTARQQYEDELRETIQRDLDYLQICNPAIFKRHAPKAKKYIPNSLQLSPKTGLPCMNDKVLKTLLVDEAAKLGVSVPISKGKKKDISTSTKDWAQYKDKSVFIHKWVTLENNAKTLQFIVELNYPNVYSNYDLLKKTGRTGASAHKGKKGQKAIPSVNIQQMPRNEKIRALFSSCEGKKMSSIDYGFIELRTLAGICRARFGSSKLGDAIEEHFKTGVIDPHEVMAASLMQLTPQEFLQLDKSIRKEKRQGGKACFHPDVEVLTSEGWVKIIDLTMQHKVAQYWPGTGLAEFVYPLALTKRENMPLIRIHNKGVDVRLTEDHRVVGYRGNGSPKVVAAKDIATLRGVWSAANIKEGTRYGALTLDTLLQAVCIQADGSFSSKNVIRFGFTKQRKIDRFKSIFTTYSEKSVYFTYTNASNITEFKVEKLSVYSCVLDENKCFKVDVLLGLPYKWRKSFIEEVRHWDGHTNKNGLIIYTSKHKKNIDAVQAVATSIGYKSSIRKDLKKNVYTLSIKSWDITRGENFNIEKLEGLYDVYCLSTPSSYVIIRDGGKPLCIGQCSFGFPGGLGVNKFREYASTQYKVTFTEDKAKEAKQTWLTTFPEMKLHLQDTTLAAVAYNLNITQQQVRNAFPCPSKWADPLRDVRQSLYEGKGMPQERHAALYGLLLNYRKDLVDLLTDVKNWRKLHDELFLYRASTLTGRVRGKVGYCDGCNSPFQGLASDGGKEALWRLMYLNYDVRAFIHDAFICMTKDENETKAIVKIMCDEMQKVIGHNIPVACDYTIGDHWVK